MTIKELLDRLPSGVVAGYDPLNHITPAAILGLARHELDLWEEGEESGITSARQARRVRRMLAESRGEEQA